MSERDQQHLAVSIGRAIARQRMRAELTQEEVAARLGIGNEAVSRIERGIVMPNVMRLLECAEIFGCDLAELLTEASHRPKEQALRMAALLEPLNDVDRAFVLDMVERLVERLKQG